MESGQDWRRFKTARRLAPQDPGAEPRDEPSADRLASPAPGGGAPAQAPEKKRPGPAKRDTPSTAVALRLASRRILQGRHAKPARTAVDLSPGVAEVARTRSHRPSAARTCGPRTSRCAARRSRSSRLSKAPRRRDARRAGGYPSPALSTLIAPAALRLAGRARTRTTGARGDGRGTSPRNSIEARIQGASVRATRKPRLSNRFPATFPLRYAARRNLGPLLQEPPRTTRSEQSPLSQALPSPGAPA